MFLFGALPPRFLEQSLLIHVLLRSASEGAMFVLCSGGYACSTRHSSVRLKCNLGSPFVCSLS